MVMLTVLLELFAPLGLRPEPVPVSAIRRVSRLGRGSSGLLRNPALSLLRDG